MPPTTMNEEVGNNVTFMSWNSTGFNTVKISNFKRAVSKRKRNISNPDQGYAAYATWDVGA